MRHFSKHRFVGVWIFTAQSESIADMREARKLSVRTGIFCLASLVCAMLFCFGCSSHEYNRQGLAQDGVTHILASGTYVSLLSFVISGVAFIGLTVSEK